MSATGTQRRIAAPRGRARASAAGSGASEWRIPAVSGTAAVEVAPSAIAADLDDGEVVIAVAHPSVWQVPTNAAGTVGAIALAVLALVWTSRVPGVPWSDAQAAMLGAVAMSIRLLWDLLDWTGRAYVLTDRRVLRHSIRLAPLPPGRAVEHLQLRHVQHVGTLASGRDRALGIGTLVFSGIRDDDESPTLVWENVRQPHEMERLVREVMTRYR